MIAGKKLSLIGLLLIAAQVQTQEAPFEVTENSEELRMAGGRLEAAIRKKGYVSGVAAGSFLDVGSGFRDAGFGLSIADFILEPGSDGEYRDRLHPELTYDFANPVHGTTAKRLIEGPQICTRARELPVRWLRGGDFVAAVLQYRFASAAPGRRAGSLWTQTLVFPEGKRYYLESQRIDAVNSSPAMFFRIDMPGHIKHTSGDTFSEIYLSYLEATNTPQAGRNGIVPASLFVTDFAPDEKLNYRRDRVSDLPRRFIRAYRLRDPVSGRQGPWLAGMSLNPASVYEAWCHQRGYVCMIQEFGGNPIQAGQSFSAAFLVGYFDSVQEMEEVYDLYSGADDLEVSESGWDLIGR